MTSSDGKWGGVFAGRADEVDGMPWMAAGTAGASFRQEDGTEGAFVGAWIAAKE